MIRDLTLADAVIVCSDMRPEDAACVVAITGQRPGEWFAVDRWQAPGPAWTLMQDGQPWAIGGLSMPNDWTGVFWFIARPGMRQASWREVVRRTRHVMQRAVDPTNPARRQRLEAHVLHGWTGASRLVDALGFQMEGIRRRAGSGGESIEVWGCVASIGAKTRAPADETPAEVEN